MPRYYDDDEEFDDLDQQRAVIRFHRQWRRQRGFHSKRYCAVILLALRDATHRTDTAVFPDA